MKRAIRSAAGRPRKIFRVVRVGAVTGSVGIALALSVAASGVLSTGSRASAASATLTMAAHRLHAMVGNGVLHAAYSLQQGSANTTLDLWAQVGTAGNIEKTALEGRDPSGALLFRTILAGGTATTYTAKTNTIQQVQEQEVTPSPIDVSGLSQLVQSAQAGQTAASLLNPQTIDGHAADGISIPEGQAHLQLYVDHNDGVTRRETLIDQNGQPLWTLNAITIAPLAATAVASDAFALNAPQSAQRAVTPDGSPNMSTQELSVSQLLAYTNRPGLVLQGDPLGLTLRDMRYTGFPHDAMLNSAYQADARAFYVSILTTDHGLATASDELGGLAKPLVATQNTQAVSLFVAGTTVQGQYYEVPTQGSSQVSRVVDFAQGVVRVRLTGDGMSRDEFFSAVGALVDGRAHLDAAARLQQELTSARPGALR